MRPVRLTAMLTESTEQQVGVDDLHQHAGGPGEAGGQIKCAHTALASRGGHQQQRMVGIGHCRQKLG